MESRCIVLWSTNDDFLDVRLFDVAPRVRNYILSFSWAAT
jgi:hypothetical protein